MGISLLSFVGLFVAVSAVGGVDAKRGFKDFASGLKRGRSSSRRYTSSSSTKTISASSSCTASSYADSYADAVDGYAKAVGVLIKDACSNGWNNNYLAKLRADVSDWAGAWASATVDTYAECTSKTSGGGKAEGCAASKASADAYSVAFAKAHAKAVAVAVDEHCTCNDVSSFSFGKAEIFEVLVAGVYNEASSIACSAGNDKSSAAAYVDCYAAVIADVYAKAVAKAAIDAECGYWSVKGASTTALADVRADIETYEYCNFAESKSGLSTTDVYGIGYAS